jgi:hypothetical protein
LGDSSPKPFVIENLIINSILLASYNFIFLALTLLNEGGLVINWGRKIKNKGNAVYPI